MKRLFLNKAVLAIACVALLQNVANAQIPAGTGGGSIGANLVNPRFVVNNPASIKGLKKITLATWGAQITTPIVNAPVAKGIDSLAALPLTNGAAISGKFCLLYRGGSITFAQKALYAQNQGAIGVIIVNNIPGDPTAMGNTGTATLSIPIIMVSDVDGNAMNQQLRNSVTVNITIGKWGIGQAHDLGILDGYASMPAAKNVPISMWSASNGHPEYKNWVGGAIANFGSSTETNVTVTDSIVWVPTSGTATLEKQTNYSIGTIAPADSTHKFGFGTAADAYYLTPKTGTGRYDYYSRIIYGNTDGLPEDNVNMFSQYINDSIFCKGTYDYVKGEPEWGISIRPSSGTTDYNLGPMFFMTRGGYAARSIQFTITKSAPATTLKDVTATAALLKWTDGSGPVTGTAKDGFMDGDEISLVGYNFKALTDQDSIGRFFQINVLDATLPDRRVVLDSNSWYWVAAQTPIDCFLGMDNATSYYTRSYVQSQNGVKDYPEAAYFSGGIAELADDASKFAFNFPFGGNGLKIDSTFYDRYNEIPAIAFHISKNRIGPNTSVGHTTVKIGDMKVFPNPAVGGFFNVSLNLDKQASKVTYRLIDGIGRMISDVVHNNVKSETFQYNTNALAVGTYYLLVIDGIGSLMQKVTIK